VPADDLHVVMVDQTDPRLGRQCVQDRASLAFPMAAPDTSTWRTHIVRIYDPTPNPTQKFGNCVGCDKCMEGNAAGNRVTRRVLTMADAIRIYSLATQRDPWDGWFNPDTGQVDTGSSGLAGCKAAQELGLGGEYRWALAGGADAVVQQIQGDKTVGIGTWWMEGMFTRKTLRGRKGEFYIEPTGPRAGGHQYRARGYDVDLDMILIRCWWGDYRDVWIRRTEFAELLADDGDAVTQDMTP
jgi:hypothetical protein